MQEKTIDELEKFLLENITLTDDQYESVIDKISNLIANESQSKRLLLDILEEYLEQLHHLPNINVDNIQSVLSDGTTQQQFKSLLLFGTQAALIRDNARLINSQRAAMDNYAELLQVVLHEFKNTAATVQAYLKEIERSMRNDRNEEAFDHLNSLDNTSKNLLALIESFHSLALIDQGKLTINWEIIDLKADVIETIEDELKPALRENTIELKTEMEREDRIFVGDQQLLHIVFRNLLNNAIQYGYPGNPIKIKIHNDAENWRISVKNFGAVPERAFLVKMFEKFSRFHEVNERSNMGLGLYIAKKIVEIHGGAIEVDSKSNEWIQFLITLPDNRQKVLDNGST